MEKDIKFKIVNYLKTLPCSEWEVSPPGSPTAKPDITGCLNGFYIAIEVKVPGKKPRKAQGYKMNRLRRAGAVVFAATSVEQVRGELRKGGFI